MKISRHLLCWISTVALAAAALPLSAKPALSAGDRAPLFSGQDQDGHTWRLSHHLGKGLVFVYFYPKDNTAGCTAEACSLRDNLAELKQIGVDVVGVSFDGKDSHKEFAFRNNLSFPLLADTSGHIADAYGARMGEDKKLDRRISFLIGLDGRIIRVTDSPDPAVHLREMTAAVAKLTGAASR
jgi:thioredoxin-dependent peroxiredoxin